MLLIENGIDPLRPVFREKAEATKEELLSIQDWFKVLKIEVVLREPLAKSYKSCANGCCRSQRPRTDPCNTMATSCDLASSMHFVRRSGVQPPERGSL
jgi:hypothetical protein